MIFLINFLIVSWVFLTASQAASFYEGHGEGWFWYHDPHFLEEREEEPQTTDLKKENPQSKEKSVEEQASETLAAYKQKLEQKLHLALVNPTSQNVQSYMQFQKDMMERSERFSKIWQQVVLTHPELNQETKFPTAQYARHAHDEKETQKKERLIRSLSKTFGLFYFFQGDCPYCEAFAPIVKMFADKYHWDVMALSLDGSPSALFENTQADHGLAEAFNIQGVPTLMAYNAQTQELIPLSHAAISLDQLEDNVMALVGGEE